MTETTNAAAPAGGMPGADPRPGLRQAAALAGTTLAAVRPNQLDDPTPCSEYSVRQLARHLIAVLRRVAVSGTGGDPMSVAHLAEDVADGGFAAAWEAGSRDVEAMLAGPDVLARQMRLPFATMPGAAALAVYTTELTVHTWDLATATGQAPAWDASVIAACVAGMGRLPAEPRGAPMPFGPVVPVGADSPDLDKLVAWYGRRP